MIISRQTALNLINDHSLVESVPQLLPFVERKRAVLANNKSGCHECQSNSLLAPIGDDVLRAVLSFPPSAIDALRVRLHDAHLYVYDPASRGRTLIELGK